MNDKLKLKTYLEKNLSGLDLKPINEITFMENNKPVTLKIRSVVKPVLGDYLVFFTLNHLDRIREDHILDKKYFLIKYGNFIME